MSSTERTRVSVVVPTMNRQDLLPEALASIRAHDAPDLKLEIIVADNGISQETRAIAQSFDAVYLPVAARGASAARNAGLKRATGEFIAFLDDDDVWLPGHLRPQIALMKADRRLLGAIGQVQLADAALSPFGNPYPSRFNSAESFESFLHTYPQLGATVIRRSTLAAVGLMDERLLNGQDWDWHLRLALAGPLGFTPTACLLFRQAPAGTRRALQWRRLTFWWRVYIANLRRAGWRWIGSHPYAVISGCRHLGTFEAFFSQRGKESLRRRDYREALVDFSMALVASPPHFAKDMLFRRPAILRFEGASVVARPNK